MQAIPCMAHACAAGGSLNVDRPLWTHKGSSLPEPQALAVSQLLRQLHGAESAWLQPLLLRHPSWFCEGGAPLTSVKNIAWRGDARRSSLGVARGEREI